MALIDVKSIQQEAEKEVRDEVSKAAKEKIKAKLKQISAAETVLANLRREYDDLLRAIGDGN